MKLTEALNAIQNNEKVLQTIYDEGLSQAYLLLDKAVCVLIAEHGDEYVQL